MSAKIPLREDETLLLQYATKHNKQHGTLFITDTRVMFLGPGGDLTVNVLPKQILKQKVSPKESAKIRLMLVIAPTGDRSEQESLTFLFRGDQALENRDMAKETILQLTQGRIEKKKKETAVYVPPEPEDPKVTLKRKRAQLLEENPYLLESYKQLVMADKVMSVDDFWESPAAKELWDAQEDIEEQENQEIGVTSGILGNTRPQGDADNDEIRYQITPDNILNLLHLYPGLRDKYNNEVPMRMTEEEFWTRVMKTHIFSRGLKKVTAEAEEDDIVRGVIQPVKDELIGAIATKKDRIDPLVDLTADGDIEIDGYGNDPMLDRPNDRKSFMRSFNADSVRILNTQMGHKDAPEAAATAASSDAPSAEASRGGATEDANDQEAVEPEPHAEENLEDQAKRKAVEDASILEARGKRLREAIELPDLYEQHPVQPLKLNVEADSYFSRFISSIGSTGDDSDSDMNNSISMRQELVSLSLEPRQSAPLMSANTALDYLMNLTKDHLSRKPKPTEIPTEYKAKIAEYDRNISVVLRHFWSCFIPVPPKSTFLIEKAKRMGDSLASYKLKQLKNLKETLGDNYKESIDDLLERVDQAIAKRTAWEAKLSSKSTKKSKKSKRSREA